MRTVKHTVKDPNGIHARPAGVLVNTAKKFESQITVSSKDKFLSKLFNIATALDTWGVAIDVPLFTVLLELIDILLIFIDWQPP